MRRLEEADFDAVLRMNNANVPAVSHLEPDELRSDLDLAHDALVVDASPASGFCITFRSGLTADLGTNYAWFSARYPRFIYLDRVVVDAAHRSQGLGELMYAEVERRMLADAFTDLFTCEVNLQPRNEGSLRFHARLGFEQVGEQESKPGLVVAMLAKRVRRNPA